MHDPTPYNMAMIMISKDDLHYLQRAGRRANKKEVDLLHDIIEKHRRPGSAASEGGRKPPDSTKDEDQGRTIPEGEVIYMTPRDATEDNQKPEDSTKEGGQIAKLTVTEGGFMVDRQMIRWGQ
jgi:hypothetical protein